MQWSDLSPKTRSVVRLAAVIVLVLAASAVFFELADDVREGDTHGFDEAVLLWLSTHRSPALTSAFLSITALGSWPVLTLLATGTCVATFLQGRRRFPLTLLAAVVGAPLLTWALKQLYGRARPTIVPHLETVAAPSFPSGHTVSSVAFFVTVALLVAAHTQGRALRSFLVGYALIIAALVAVSRMYLGVHYPSDVAAGALLGIAWSLLCVTGERLLRDRVA